MATRATPLLAAVLPEPVHGSDSLVASAAGICIIALLAFGRNLEIELTTGVVWSAITDSPHDHATGLWGRGLWPHVTLMVIWAFSALYQILWSGPRKRDRIRRSLPRAHDAESEGVEVDVSLDEAVGGGASTSSSSFSPHNFVGQFIAAPALFVGCLAGGVWWQFTSGAPTNSPAVWYTQGLFVCSFGQLVLGIRRAKASAATRRKLTALVEKGERGKQEAFGSESSTPSRQETSESESSSPVRPSSWGQDQRVCAAQQRNHLEMHQIYIFLACAWVSDPGLHRVSFWARILAVWLEPTRNLFYELGTTFEEARDDRDAQTAITIVGKMPVQLTLMFIVGLAIVRRKREIVERRDTVDVEVDSDGDNSHFVLFANFLLMSCWFLSNAALTLCGFLLPSVSGFLRALIAGMLVLYIGIWWQLNLHRILRDGFYRGAQPVKPQAAHEHQQGRSAAHAWRRWR